MGDAADHLTEQGLSALALHRSGRCGEYGPCQHCEETVSTALATTAGDDVERVLIGGDLSRLSAEQRVVYYQRVCDSLGLNPLTKPFEYLTLQGKTILYARRDCTEQLRKRDGVSVVIAAREVVEGVYVVTARATAAGRTDESIGAVPIDGLKGEARANAMMKAETKAKRRVTLSICGLGMLDESEVESIPGAQPAAALPPRAEPVPHDEPDDADDDRASPILAYLDALNDVTTWQGFDTLRSEANADAGLKGVSAADRDELRTAFGNVHKRLTMALGAQPDATDPAAR